MKSDKWREERKRRVERERERGTAMVWVHYQHVKYQLRCRQTVPALSSASYLQGEWQDRKEEDPGQGGNKERRGNRVPVIGIFK